LFSTRCGAGISSPDTFTVSSSNTILWRLVFYENEIRRHPFDCGPWHPDKARVEALALHFRALGQSATVQSNLQAGRTVQSRPSRK
jgi:hypothetical protein